MASRGTSGAEAERLMERWLTHLGYIVHRAHKSVKRWPKKGAARCGSCGRAPEVVMTQQHDLWNCIDFLAFAEDGKSGPYGDVWLLQVTTQAGRSARRRKLEEIAWPADWRVSLASHEKTPDPANRARRVHHWRVEDLSQQHGWLAPRAIEFDPKVL